MSDHDTPVLTAIKKEIVKRRHKTWFFLGKIDTKTPQYVAKAARKELETLDWVLDLFPALPRKF